MQAVGLVGGAPFAESVFGQRRDGEQAAGRQQPGQPRQARVQVAEPLDGQAGADQVVAAGQAGRVLAVDQLVAHPPGRRRPPAARPAWPARYR